MSDKYKFKFISARSAALFALLIFGFYSACGDDGSNNGYICSEYTYEVVGECVTNDDCGGDAFCDGEQCLLLIEENDSGDAETDAAVDDEEPATPTENGDENEIIILEVCQEVESDSCVHR